MSCGFINNKMHLRRFYGKTSKDVKMRSCVILQLHTEKEIPVHAYFTLEDDISKKVALNKRADGI